MDIQHYSGSTDPESASRLKILYRRDKDPIRRSVFSVVHSDRSVDFGQCELNYLAKRYESANRLSSLPLFDSLKPAHEYNPYLGSVSLWQFKDSHSAEPVLLAHIRPSCYKPQHALWHDKLLWIIGTESIYVYDAEFRCVRIISDPWMAGGHTITQSGNGNLLTTWSASDSLITIDANSLSVCEKYRLPEVPYGSNYHLKRIDSVIDHYIHNDLQLTHINAAWPYQGGTLVSLLIPGAIGWFDSVGNYQEIIRGFVGCHGVRTDHAGQIYFCDSCMGTVNFINRNGELLRRVDCASRWLHDALEIEAGLFAIAAADRNSIDIVDFTSKELILKIEASEFGESVQFLSYSTTNQQRNHS